MRAPTRALVLPLVLVAGCPDVSVPADALIACDADDDCPDGWRCVDEIGRCVDDADPDDAPPTLTITVDPVVAGPGTVVTWTVVADEDLGAQPVVTVGDATATLVSEDGRTSTHTYEIVGTEPSPLSSSVRAIDTRGNVAVVSADEITIDTAAPVVGGLLLQAPAGQSAVKGGDVVTLAGAIDDTTATLVNAVVLLEDGGNTTTTPVTLRPRPGALAELTLPSLVDGAVVRVRVDAVDGFGNSASFTTTNALSADESAPATPFVRLSPTDVTGELTVGVTLGVDGFPDTVGEPPADTAVCVKAFDVGDSAPPCADADFVATFPTTIDLPAGDGRKRVQAIFRDGAHNVSTPAADDVVFVTGGVVPSTVTLTPPAGQVRVKNGDFLTVTATSLPGATVAGARLLDGAGAEIPGVSIPLASVGDASSGAFAGTFILPPRPDDSVIVAEVIMDFGGVQSAAAESRSAALSVDNERPVIRVSVDGSPDLQSTSLPLLLDVQNGDDVAAVTVAGDVVVGVPPTFDAGRIEGVFVLDVVLDENGDPIPERTVVVTVTDGAGNQSIAVVTGIRLLNAAPGGTPLLRNAARRGVPGIRPTDVVEVDGAVDPTSTVQSAALAYLDDADVEIVACRQVLVDVTQVAGDLAGTATATPCVGAASVRVEIVLESPSGLVSDLLRSPALYLDGTAPTVTATFVAPADAQGARTGTLANAIEVDATDAHPVFAVKLLGDAEPIGDAAVDNGFIPLVSPLPFTTTAGEGSKTIVVLVQDEVGNETSRTVTFTLDQTPSAPPDAARLRLEERAPDTDVAGALGDAQSAFRLNVDSGAVGAGDRLLVLVGGNRVGTPASIPGAGLRIDLPAPSRIVDVHSVDDAGNLSAPTTLTLPLLTLSIDGGERPVGRGSTVVTVRSDIPAGAVGAATLAADLTLRAAGRDATCVVDADDPDNAARCTFALQDGDGPEGFTLVDGIPRGDAVMRAVWSPPRVLTTDAREVIADLTPPTLSGDDGVLFVDGNAPGTADQLIGLAGAVIDLAGADVIGDRFPPVVTATPSDEGTAQASADGSFSFGLGDQTTAAVSVVAIDAAGNTSTPHTLVNDIVAPVVVVESDRARAGDGTVLGLSISVADASPLSALPSVTVGGRAATVTDAPLDGGTFVASFVVDGALDLAGTRTVTASVVDASGNEADATATVIFDFSAPTITVLTPARTADRVQRATIVDVGGGTVSATATVTDDGDGTVVFDAALSGAGDTFSTPSLAGLVDGHDYTISVTATDDVGNVAVVDSAFRFDTSGPALAVSVDTTADPSDTSPPVTVTVTDGDPVAVLECRLDAPGEAFSPCSDTAHGFSVVVGAGSLRAPFGTHTLEVRATDDLGNVGAVASATFSIVRRVDVDMARSVLCAVRAGTLTCRGDNRDGRLGTGAGDTLGPTIIGAGHTWRAVDVGSTTICALDDAGALFCWGDNGDKRAAVDGPAFVEPPGPATTPAAPGPFVDVQMRDDGGCALTAGGELQCWGRLPGSADAPTATPTTVATDVLAFASGDLHVLLIDAITHRGRALGRGTEGQLGTGAAVSSAIPLALAGPLSDVGLLSVSAGRRHGCAVRARDKAVFCFGDNARGAVTGVATSIETTPVATAQEPALQVLASADRSCGVGVDGVARCHGVLSHGEVAAPSAAPRGPTAIVGVSFDEIVGADGTLCGATRDQASVRCVGENGRGEIDRTALRAAPAATPAAIPGDEQVRALAVGPHAVCALTVTGARACSGANDGNIRILDVSTAGLPTSDEFAPAAGDFVDMAIGDDYACAVDGAGVDSIVVCAGDAAAPLARVDVSDPLALVPATVAGVALTHVGAGLLHACATGDVDGDVFCWGDPGGGLPATATPTGIGLSDARAPLAVGDGHTCVRVADGVACFGDNGVGQLGLGDTTARAGVQRIVALDGGGDPAGLADGPGVQLDAGGDTTCAGHPDGGVYCWGENDDGEAGQRPSASVPTPTLVELEGGGPLGGVAVAVAVGDRRGCAVMENGGDRALFCWGVAFDDASRVIGAIAMDGNVDWQGVVLSASGEVACGLRGATALQGAVHCFGDAADGALGDGRGFVETATEVLP